MTQPSAASEIPLVATVVCRSEHRGDQRPVAVIVGGRRLAVADVLDERILGPREAGTPLVRQLRVRLDDGSDLRLERRLPDGPWLVFRPAGA